VPRILVILESTHQKTMGWQHRASIAFRVANLAEHRIANRRGFRADFRFGDRALNQRTGRQNMLAGGGTDRNHREHYEQGDGATFHDLLLKKGIPWCRDSGGQQKTSAQTGASDPPNPICRRKFRSPQEKTFFTVVLYPKSARSPVYLWQKNLQQRKCRPLRAASVFGLAG